MKTASVVGYVLVATVLATVLLFVGFYGWICLFPKQADRLELGILIIFLTLPVLGTMIGTPVGVLYAYRRSPDGHPGQRPTIIQFGGTQPALEVEQTEAGATHPTASSGPAPLPRRLPRNAEGPSTVDGVTLLVVALVPGVWSAILFGPDPVGSFQQACGGVLEAAFFLGPVGATIGLVLSGVAVLRRTR